jgi:cyclopropane fatty-acyl-phospholipid synthase-like methyltransferase
MFSLKSLFHREKEKPKPEDLGIGLPPGASHYRAYVGPPEDYDTIAAMTFGLLTSLGLRQHHALLDIGCGSLRIGRLLIPYLNVGKYTGIEPNRWLIDDGIARETGHDQIAIKQPAFFEGSTGEALIAANLRFDFVVAHSIFSHCGPDLLQTWLQHVSQLLVPTGAFVATFMEAEQDTTEQGWIYPGCVAYRRDSLAEYARATGLRFEILDWRHPRQTWALFAAPKYDSSWFANRPLSWNTWHDYGRSTG